jgi:hypothetical protein
MLPDILWAATDSALLRSEITVFNYALTRETHEAFSISSLRVTVPESIRKMSYSIIVVASVPLALAASSICMSTALHGLDLRVDSSHVLIYLYVDKRSILLGFLGLKANCSASCEWLIVSETNV